MSNSYSNIPYANVTSDPLVQAFDAYLTEPLELSSSVLDAMKGFFTGKGFDPGSAETIAVIIIKQAKHDNYNPMTILDTLRGLDSIEISALVAEILNYNRFKTSYLGYALEFTPHQEVVRNILA